jgi:hypothetical protein
MYAQVCIKRLLKLPEHRDKIHLYSVITSTCPRMSQIIDGIPSTLTPTIVQNIAYPGSYCQASIRLKNIDVHVGQ